MKLCGVCSSIYGLDSAKNTECNICNNQLEKTSEMIKKGKEKLEEEKEKGAKSFCISTLMPKEWRAREEKVFDIKLSKSIKAGINKKISHELEEIGLNYDVIDGDVRVVFDYPHTRTRIKKRDMFVYGKYNKLKKGLCQTEWDCRECNGQGCKECNNGKKYPSIEGKIAKGFGCENYTLHASGREDVDATNTGGRPFVFRIESPKRRDFDLKKIEDKIEEGVEIHGLEEVRRGFVELVTETHTDKTYKAEIKTNRELGEEDEKLIEGIEGVVEQKTPSRVSHRRAKKTRKREIRDISLSINETGGVLRIKAEAGTYIKELITGDNGRTQPNISNILNTHVECTNLEVTDIDTDYIDFCLPKYSK